MDTACINWLGLRIACLVTFPLVFGWMYFTMEENGYYTVVAMGMNIMEIKANGFIAYVSYNALNISALMVITGVMYGAISSLKNMQARAEQKFIYDFLPLYLLVICKYYRTCVNLMNMFLHGYGHR